MLDGQAPGPDFVITAPFELKTARPLDPASRERAGPAVHATPSRSSIAIASRRSSRALAPPRRTTASRSKTARPAREWRSSATVRSTASRCGRFASVLALEPFLAHEHRAGRRVHVAVHLPVFHDSLAAVMSRPSNCTATSRSIQRRPPTPSTTSRRCTARRR